MPGAARPAVTFLAAWAATSPLAAADGRTIFQDGSGVAARIAGTGVTLPAGRLGCAGCHGADARGGGEGAAVAPAVGWPALAAATATRPAYDLAALGRALRDGVDPAGRPLDSRMPRFDIDDAGLAALAGYLGAIDREETAGLTATTIAVRLPAAHEDRIATLAAINDFNAAGPAFGRQAIAVDGDAPATIDARMLLPPLRERLARARAEQLAALSTAAAGTAPTPPGPIYGDAAMLASRVPDLVSEGYVVVLLGAPANALIWAREVGLPGSAADSRTLVRLALEALRAPGRRLTHTAAERAVTAMPLGIASEIYRFGEGQEK